MSVFAFRCGDRGAVMSVSGAVPSVNGRCWTREWKVTSSDDKNRIIEELQNLFKGQDEDHDFLGQRAELIVDEMLENALYSAPRDSFGNPLFAKGSPREIFANENISLRCGFDGEQLFLEVSDSWGNLLPETVEYFLAMNNNDVDPGNDRAGRGLYILWQFLDYFYVNLNPGVETSMGGVLRLNPINVEKGDLYGTSI